MSVEEDRLTIAAREQAIDRAKVGRVHGIAGRCLLCDLNDVDVTDGEAVAGVLSRAYYEPATGSFRCSPRDARQAAVYRWALGTFGEIAADRIERVSRLLEEAVELTQAEGLDQEKALEIVLHVYRKPAGDPTKEAGAVGACLLCYCAAVGISAEAEEAREVARVMALPAEHFRARQNIKAAAGVALAIRRERHGPDGHEIMPRCATCGKPKNPLGRSAPLEMANSLCGWDCPGYREDPFPSSYWRPDEDPLPGTPEAGGR